MSSNLVLDLDECTEYRQAVAARAPRIVHGTAILLILLLGIAITWMAVTRVNLVVRAAGRVRPISQLEHTREHFSEQLSSDVGGRVIEMNVAEGYEVRAGDVLIRLDTERLDNQIAKLRRTIQTGQDELTKLEQLGRVLEEQHVSARQKAEAELAAAEESVRLAKEQQAVDIRLAELQLQEAQDQASRTRLLAAKRTISEQERIQSVIRLEEAKEHLAKAQLPLDEGNVKVLRRSLELVQRDYKVKRADVEIKQSAKLGEIEANKLELANLQIERERSVIHAMSDGVITKAEVKVGDIIEPGKLPITMARQRGFEFEVAVASADVAHLKPGMPSRIKLDAYDHQQYGTLGGTLRFVAPDSEVNEGTAIYKVKIELAEDELLRGEHRGQVKLGMTGHAEIVSDKESILMLLLKKIRQSVSLG